MLALACCAYDTSNNNKKSNTQDKPPRLTWARWCRQGAPSTPVVSTATVLQVAPPSHILSPSYHHHFQWRIPWGCWGLKEDKPRGYSMVLPHGVEQQLLPCLEFEGQLQRDPNRFPKCPNSSIHRSQSTPNSFSSPCSKGIGIRVEREFGFRKNASSRYSWLHRVDALVDILIPRIKNMRRREEGRGIPSRSEQRGSRLSIWA